MERATNFGPLLRWVLAWWAPEEQRMVLAMDATTLGQRFTVLAVRVVDRGCAIPIAWTVVGAANKGAWRTYWEDLFRHIGAQVPPDWTVVVLADRGLYAKWLFQAIVAVGWHPFLRINQGGQYRPWGQRRCRPLAQVAPEKGTRWQGVVDCFRTRNARLTCTLVAQWKGAHAEPWLILTDLSPEVAQAAWYSLRFWIEGSFQDLKRGGWQWHQTKMTDPARAARLWLAMAVATLWVVSVGGAAEAALPASSLDALPLTHVARTRSTQTSRPRLVSCFKRGVLTLLAASLCGDPLPLGRFLPTPWPSTLPLTPIRALPPPAVITPAA